MKIINKLLLQSFLSTIVVCIPLIAPSHASTDDQRIDLKFNGQTMSADLKDVSLKLILEKIKSERGMWFRGSESVLAERVSVQFKDSPMQEALKRILFDINYVLFFDSNNKLVGAVILGRVAEANATPLPADTGSRLEFSSQTVKENGNNPFAGLSSALSKNPPKAKRLKQAITQMVGEDASEGSPTSDNPFATALNNPFAQKAAADAENAPNSENSQVFPFMPKVSSTSEQLTGSKVTKTTENPFAKKAFLQKGNPFEKNIE
jgi:hypothetical protein